MKLSFEELPNAVSEIFSKLTNIERLLQEKKSETQAADEELLTIKQAAGLLKVSVPTIYGYVHQAEIPYCKIKKRLYFSRKELTAWVQTGRKKTSAESQASAHLHLKRKL